MFVVPKETWDLFHSIDNYFIDNFVVPHVTEKMGASLPREKIIEMAYTNPIAKTYEKDGQVRYQVTLKCNHRSDKKTFVIQDEYDLSTLNPLDEPSHFPVGHPYFLTFQLKGLMCSEPYTFYPNTDITHMYALAKPSSSGP